MSGADEVSPMPRATLVVVAEAVLRADAAHSVLAAERDRPGVAVWHRVARDGCTAQLLLEATDPALAYRPANATTGAPLAAAPAWVEGLVVSADGTSSAADRRTLLLLRNLLGLTPGDGLATLAEEAETLRNRYPKLKAALFSSCSPVVRLANGLGWQAASLGRDADWREWAGPVSSALQHCQVVLVHARSASGCEAHLVDALGALADAVKAPDVELVFVATHPADAAAGTSGLYQRLATLRSRATLVGAHLPRQSFEVLAGRPVVTERLPVLAAYHLNGHTRRDGVTEFTETAIGASAGLGILLAYYFFPELLYGVGVAGKYGA